MVSTESPLNSTFGIELEFLMKFHPSHITPKTRTIMAEEGYPLTDDISALQLQISLILDHAGIPIHSPLDNFDQELSPNKWAFVSDSSLSSSAEAAADPDHNYTTVELRSRVLSSTPEDLPASLQEIKKVLHFLTNQPYKCLTNTSTAFHVHVGNQSAGFPLNTLKNLSLTVLAFAHAIESLHPDHRISALPSNKYSQPPSRAFPASNGLFANLFAIESCTTPEALISLMNPSGPKTCAYNFGNLDARQLERMESVTRQTQLRKTVEFRQHAGTVDAGWVCAWVEFVLGLVEWCHHVLSGALLPLVMMGGEHPGFGVGVLTRFFGKGHVGRYYEEGGLIVERERGWRGDEVVGVGEVEGNKGEGGDEGEVEEGEGGEEKDKRDEEDWQMDFLDQY